MTSSTQFTYSLKNVLVGGLVFVWVASTVFAFWWFQFRNIRSFDSAAVKSQTVFFESGELGGRLETLVKSRNNLKAIKVVHFWDPDCPCSRFNEVHVKKIIADYKGQNVEFTVVVRGQTQEVRTERKLQAQQVFNDVAVKEVISDWPVDKGPPSSPAVGVMNNDGELVYFGPYSLGARCTQDKGQFVEKVLDGLSTKKTSINKKQLNTLAVGCFCPWREVG
jgi:hypothetical protein